jgi:hypothetical protein
MALLLARATRPLAKTRRYLAVITIAAGVVSGCASDGCVNCSAEDLDPAAIGSLANLAVAIATGEEAPMPDFSAAPAQQYGMGQDQIDSCTQEANQMQVASQSWGGSVQDISRQLGQSQKQLFEGRCAGHPQAAAYLAGANRMLGDAEYVPQAPQTADNGSNVMAALNDAMSGSGGSGGSGGGDACTADLDAMAHRMNAWSTSRSSIVEQIEVLMQGMTEMIAIVDRQCPGHPARADFVSTLASSTRTCNQTASRTCRPDWHGG